MAIFVLSGQRRRILCRNIKVTGTHINTGTFAEDDAVGIDEIDVTAARCQFPINKGRTLSLNEV